MHDEIVRVYEEGKELDNVVEKLKPFYFKDLAQTAHFRYSVLEKSSDIKLIETIFRDFDRIKLVNKRKHKTSNKESYDFYYELSDKTYLIYAISLEEPVPRLINAYHIQRNFKKFRQKLMTAYKDKLIG